MILTPEVKVKTSALRRLSLLSEKARYDWFELRYKTASHTRLVLVLKVSCTSMCKHIQHRIDHRIKTFARDLCGCLSFIWSIPLLGLGRSSCPGPWVAVLYLQGSRVSFGNQPLFEVGFFLFSDWDCFCCNLCQLPLDLRLAFTVASHSILRIKLLKQMSGLYGGWKAGGVTGVKGLWSEVQSPTGRWLVMTQGSVLGPV